MKTFLTPERLAVLHGEGRAQAAGSPFVDPYAVYQLEVLLRERGEEWVASVLLRDLSCRSIGRPSYPWLHDGEMETLILANRSEIEVMERSLGESE